MGVALLYKEQELRKRRKAKAGRPFLPGSWMEQEKGRGEPSEEKDDCWEGVGKSLLWGLQQPSVDLEDTWVVVLISFCD